MNGIATKLPVEVFVCLQQGDRNSSTSKKERQHHSSWPAADNAAGGLLRIKYWLSSGNRHQFCSHPHSPCWSCSERNYTPLSAAISGSYSRGSNLIHSPSCSRLGISPERAE